MKSTDQSRVPMGWTESILQDIREDLSASINPAKYPEESFELYSVPSHATGRPEVLKGSRIGSSKKTLVPGTVVVCKINPRINRVWVVGRQGAQRQIGSSEWIPFFPQPGLVPRFLAYFLRQDSVRNFLAAKASGVGGSLMRVRPMTLDSIRFPLAPSQEQTRIVEALDSYFTRLDDAEATLERVKRNIEHYRSSVLQAAVEGRLVPREGELAHCLERTHESASELLNRIIEARLKRGERPEPEGDSSKISIPLPEGWCWTTVGQLAEVGTGATPLRGQARYWRDGTIPWVASRAVNSREIHEATEFVTEAALKETNLELFPRGTLVVAMYGEGQTRGRVAMLRIESTTNQALAGVVLRGPAECARRWLRMVLEAGYLRIRRQASGGVQPNLNLRMIRSIPVPLPPVQEQDRIGNEVDRLLSAGEAIMLTVAQNEPRRSRLRQQILREAFDGCLVDQDPTDEPASVLLDRLRAERAKAASSPETPRRRGRPREAVKK